MSLVERLALEKELAALLNRYSVDSDSNTPDYILAIYVLSCLEAWTTAVQQRETWLGRDARPSAPQHRPATPPMDREPLHDNVRRPVGELVLDDDGVWAVFGDQKFQLRKGK